MTSPNESIARGPADADYFQPMKAQPMPEPEPCLELYLVSVKDRGAVGTPEILKVWAANPADAASSARAQLRTMRDDYATEVIGVTETDVRTFL
jgi:hypothetical protein